MRAYWEFAAELAVDEFPPDPATVRLYATWLMLKKCGKEDSMRQYLSALKTHCNKLGLYVPSPSEFGPLAAVVSGAKRLFPGPTRQARPVTPTILRNLVFSRAPANATWCQRTTLQALKDVSILLFFSLLRSSSLMPPFPAAADKIRNLTWRQVRFIQGGAVLSILLSKTQQYRRKVHQVVLVERPGSPFCPVSAIRRLNSMRGAGVAQETDHVCMLPSESGAWTVMVKYQFLSWFQTRISQMGLRKECYLLHSFRHGGVALAMSEEPNLQLIRLQSNHLSNAVHVYSQLEVGRRLTVASAMINALDSSLALSRAGAALARL